MLPNFAELLKLNRLHAEPAGASCARTARTLSTRFSLGRLNEVWLRWFPAPAFGYPFHSLPFTHTFFPSFVSCLSVFMSWHVILSLQPLVCTRTHTLNPGLRSPLLQRGWVHRSFLVTWFRFIATTYIWSVLSSFHVVIRLSFLHRQSGGVKTLGVTGILSDVLF